VFEVLVEPAADTQLTTVDADPQSSETEAVLVVPDDLAVGSDVAWEVVVGGALMATR
jgi:uncharacterized protein (DUF952 family)